MRFQTTPNFSKTIRGRTGSDSIFSLSTTSRERSEGSGSSEITIDDLIFTSSSSASVFSEDVINTDSTRDLSFSSTNENILTVDKNGATNWVSDGSASVLVNDGIITRKIKASVSRLSGQTTNVPNRYASGTVGKALTDLADTLTNVSTDKAMFSNGNWNTNFFAYSERERLSCIAFKRNGSNTSFGRARTLITPRHMIGTEHTGYQLQVGDTITFLTSDNTEITKTVTGKATSAFGSGSDIAVYTLDSDVTGITPAKLLPSDFFSEVRTVNGTNVGVLKYINFNGKAPLFSTDKDSRLSIRYNSLVQNVWNDAFRTDSFLGDYNDFEESLISGDSGNPLFIILDNQLVLISCFTSETSNTNYGSSTKKAIINQLIIDADTNAGVSTGLTTTDIDLSSFNSYS